MNEDVKTQAFMKLLVENQRNIQAFILYIVPNRVDADDILQETFTEMWSKYDDYKKGTSFVAWGITIAKYKILAHQRKHQTKKRYFAPHTMELLMEEAETTDKRDGLDEKIDILKACLKKLSEKEKRYLALRYEENLTFQMIAEHFDLSMQAAYKAVSVIHARLLLCVRSKMRREDLI